MTRRGEGWDGWGEERLEGVNSERVRRGETRSWFRIRGAWFMVQGSGCGVQGAGCRVQGAGCRVH